LTAEAEEAEQQLESFTTNKSLAVRLGAYMLAKNVKISDLVNGWDSTDGEVSPKQFRKNVRALLADASAEETDALFVMFDADGGGTLDLDELKLALATLKDALKEDEKELARLRRKSASLAKTAKAAQLEFRKLHKADEAEAHAKVEAEEAAKAKAAAEEAMAKAAKEAKEAAAKKAKEEDNALYEAKIKLRRASTASGASSAAAAAAAAALAVLQGLAATKDREPGAEMNNCYEKKTVMDAVEPLAPGPGGARAARVSRRSP